MTVYYVVCDNLEYRVSAHPHRNISFVILQHRASKWLLWLPMPPLQQPPLPKAPQPTRVFFDPFNSSSRGHQYAENRLAGSTSWRDSRKYKLGHQFKDRTGGGGQKHLSDLVGAGSEHFENGRKGNRDWEVGTPGLREKGCQDIRGLLGTSGKRAREDGGNDAAEKRRRTDSEPARSEDQDEQATCAADAAYVATSTTAIHTEEETKELPQIFRGLTMYLNGSTMPLVSDHRLKHLWVQHGGNASIALGRRTVTHVILGEKGTGGGLAATKIQKENTTVRGKGVKYVSVQWVLDSIDKGIRQPESRYVAAGVKDKLGGSGQPSVATLFRATGG